MKYTNTENLNRIFTIFSVSCFFIFICLLSFARDVFIVDIADGDTVYTSEGEKIRLLGVDTPEMGYKDVKGKYFEKKFPYADEAKVFLTNTVLNETCHLEFDEDKLDRYGRTLAFVYRKRDNYFVNEAILSAGLATVSFYPPNLKFYKEFLAAQKEARTEAVNIWSLDKIRASDAHKHIGALRTIVGVVKSVYLAKNYCYLNFSDNYKTDFTIGIAKKNLLFFKDLPRPVEKWYTGKKVEVTARIYQRNGPFVQVALPEQIIVLD